MSRLLAAMAVSSMLFSLPAFAGDAEVKAAQSTIDAQIKAFLANDNDKAYSFAAPGIKRIFPTVDAFMSLVERAYQPVWHPKSYAFGKAEENGTTITQHVLVVGPEAVYTLEPQPDGTYQITGVSLRASETVGA